MAEPTDEPGSATGANQAKHDRVWTVERAMSELSTASKRRFVKDFSLPISILSSPYFEYFIELYDKTLKTKEKFSLLVDALNQLGGDENRFLSFHNNLSDRVMKVIGESDGYKKLIDNRSSEDMARFQQQHQEVKSATGIGGKIYSSPNHNKYFISLDLVTANFNSMRFYDPSIFLNCQNWIEFISKFTDIEYYKRSKYFRQIIFGHLNPKKQATITKFISSEICKVIVNSSDPQRFKLTFYSHDELVYHCVNTESAPVSAVKKLLQDDVEYLQDLLSKNLPQFAPIVRFEVFRLKRVDPSTAFYAKEDIDLDASSESDIKISDVILKCVSAAFYAQVFKKYYGLPITDVDRKVYFEGFLATLDKDVFDPSVEKDTGSSSKHPADD